MDLRSAWPTRIGYRLVDRLITYQDALFPIRTCAGYPQACAYRLRCGSTRVSDEQDALRHHPLAGLRAQLLGDGGSQLAQDTRGESGADSVHGRAGHAV